MNEKYYTWQWRHKSQSYDGFTIDLVQEGCTNGFHWAVVKTTRNKPQTCSWDWIEKLELKIDISMFNFAEQLFRQGKIKVLSPIDVYRHLKDRTICIKYRPIICSVSPSPWESGYGIALYLNIPIDLAFSSDEKLRRVVEGKTMWLEESDYECIVHKLLDELRPLFDAFKSCNVLTLPGGDGFDYEMRVK